MDTTGFTVAQVQEIARRLNAICKEDAELEGALWQWGHVTFRAADRLSIDILVQKKQGRRAGQADPSGDPHGGRVMP